MSGGLPADDASTCMNVFCDSVVANETTCNKKKKIVNTVIHSKPTLPGMYAKAWVRQIIL